MDNTPSPFISFLPWLLLLLIYFLPTAIAVLKKHPQKTPIILVNIFAGLIGGVGWIIALIWCFITPRPSGMSVSCELEKLHGLKEKGIISETEFENQKRVMLAKN